MSERHKGMKAGTHGKLTLHEVSIVFEDKFHFAVAQRTQLQTKWELTLFKIKDLLKMFLLTLLT